MKLIYTHSNEEFDADIVEVQLEEYQAIKKSKQFGFDWDKEKTNQVFKLEATDVESPEILGLISLTDIPQEFRTHINLIENSKENQGKSKKIDRIAGCLLAFACQISFERGYNGFTSLVPKTVLIPLYVEKYSFIQFGRQLAIDGKAAISLIEKYL